MAADITAKTVLSVPVELLPETVEALQRIADLSDVYHCAPPVTSAANALGPPLEAKKWLWQQMVHGTWAPSLDQALISIMA